MTSNVPALRVIDQGDAKMMHKFATDATLRWMDEIVAHHERAARDLREQANRFRRAADAQRHNEEDTATPVEALSWFVNATKFVAINSRTDLAVNHASTLALAAAQLKA